MSSAQGRRFVFDIIDRHCNLHGGSYTESPTRSAFNEGKRAVGIELRLELSSADRIQYVHMLNEQLSLDDVGSEPQQSEAE